MRMCSSMSARRLQSVGEGCNQEEKEAIERIAHHLEPIFAKPRGSVAAAAAGEAATAAAVVAGIWISRAH